jgi:hypothetical protein
MHDQVLLASKFMSIFHHQTVPAIKNTALLSTVTRFNFTGVNQENGASLFLGQQWPPSWLILSCSDK